MLSPDHLPAVLAVSLTAVHLVRPVYGPSGTDLRDFSLDYLNPAGQRMLGLPEQPGGTVLTRFPHPVAPGIFGYYQRVFEQGELGPYEVHYEADGQTNYYRFQAQRSGEVLVVSFTDVPAAPARAAAALGQRRELVALAEAQAQHQRLHQVLMRLSASIALLTGPDHVYTLVNPEYERLFPNRPLLGHSLRQAIPEISGQGFDELMDRVYQTGESFYEPETEVWADFAGTGGAEQRYYRTSFEPIRDAQGQVVEVLNFAVDVTEQVAARQRVQTLNEELAVLNEKLRATNNEYHVANEALREAQQQLHHLNQELEARVQERTGQLSEQQALLRQILSHVPAYIATLSGPEHRYSFFNDAYRALSGGRIALGRRAVDVFPEIVPQGFGTLLDHVYASGEAVTGTEILGQLVNHATGRLEPLHADFFYQPLFDAHQQVQGILAYVQDVSEKVRARRQVQELNEQLTLSNHRLMRTNADLDTFVYTASHDLKAPMANIEGILSALRTTLPETVQQEAVTAHLLGLLDHTVQRFMTTLSHLTDLSRLQQTYAAPAEQLALAPVVAGVVEDLTPIITAAGAQVHLHVPADLRVSFAPASLRSIVYNLLSNAVKYHDPARPVQVWLQAEAHHSGVVLTVRDNGLGLDETQQQRLLGAFQRLHTHVEGTGVGLYMIKRLIDNAGASIAVTSAPGVGSTFTVTFPLT